MTEATGQWSQFEWQELERDDLEILRNTPGFFFFLLQRPVEIACGLEGNMWLFFPLEFFLKPCLFIQITEHLASYPRRKDVYYMWAFFFFFGYDCSENSANTPLVWSCVSYKLKKRKWENQTTIKRCKDKLVCYITSTYNLEQGKDLWIGHIFKKVMYINKNQELFTQDLDCMWPPDVKSQLIGKVPDVGKDWGQEEKGMTEDEMVGWHHQIIGFEQILEDSEGQGCLVCCSPWGSQKVRYNLATEQQQDIKNNLEMI